jgi:hypothetical protein
MLVCLFVYRGVHGPFNILHAHKRGVLTFFAHAPVVWRRDSPPQGTEGRQSFEPCSI